MTRRQHSLLAFLLERRAAGLEAPSFAEMAAAIGLRSKGGVHRIVAALEERGFVRRVPHRTRAVEVIESPPHEAIMLIGAVLKHPAVELVEHAHPGWRRRALSLLHLRAAGAVAGD